MNLGVSKKMRSLLYVSIDESRGFKPTSHPPLATRVLVTPDAFLLTPDFLLINFELYFKSTTKNQEMSRDVKDFKESANVFVLQNTKC